LFEAPELHQYLNKRELALELPLLQTQQLQGGFAYYDAYMDDDRLVLETLRSAFAHGAQIASYVRAGGATFEGGKITSIACEDLETGACFPLRARHFISSVGPWTDQFGKTLFADWRKHLRPSKGVHLTFMRDRFPLKDAIVMIWAMVRVESGRT
jgi:glycerol-3-phosphate dehydrogenase